MVQELTQLPDREFLLWMKRAPFGAQQVRSSRLDIAALRRAAEDLAPDAREAIRRGTVSMRRQELEALIETASPRSTPATSLTAELRRQGSRLG